MDDEVSQDDLAGARSGNWTIKNMPLEARLGAVQAARRADVSTAEWLTKAIEAAIAQQGRNGVLAPEKAPRQELAIVGQQSEPSGPAQKLAFVGQQSVSEPEPAQNGARATPEGLRELAQAYAALTGAGAPRRLLGSLEGLLRQDIRMLRGTAMPRKPKALPAAIEPPPMLPFDG